MKRDDRAAQHGKLVDHGVVGDIAGRDAAIGVELDLVKERDTGEALRSSEAALGELSALIELEDLEAIAVEDDWRRCARAGAFIRQPTPAAKMESKQTSRREALAPELCAHR